MAMTPIRPLDSPTPSAATPPVERSPQAEDVARFEGALSQSDKEGRSEAREEVREDVREEDRRSDDPSSLFRRREPPDRDRGGKGGDGGDGRRDPHEGRRDLDRETVTLARGKGLDREPLAQTVSEAMPAVLQSTTLPVGVLPLASPTMEATTPAATVAALVNEIVDAVQVAQTGPDGADEVRIQLNSAVLGGSEIRLVNAGKGLEITFVCATKDTETFLVSRQAELSALLGDRLGREVRVQVIDPSHDEASRPRHEADARGGGDGRQDQGRSRNRHLYDTGKDA